MDEFDGKDDFMLVTITEFTRFPDPDTPSNRNLLAAVEAQDVNRVREALADGGEADCTVDYLPDTGNPLHGVRRPLPFLAASDFAHSEVFRLLVESVRNPNLSYEGMDLLHLALYQCPIEVIAGLLAKGANPNPEIRPGSADTPPLSQSVGLAAGPAPEVAALLLDYGADPNGRAANSMTALMMAARTGKRELVELLIRRGADPSIRAQTGTTALDFARKGGHLEVEKILAPLTELNVHEAARLGRIEIVEDWIRQGSDLDARDGKGNTLLHATALGRDPIAARRLIQAGASVDPYNPSGQTPLYLASERGDVVTMRVLLDAGAHPDMDAEPAFDAALCLTPLLVAIRQWEAEAVDLLLERGAEWGRYRQGERALSYVLQHLRTREFNPSLRIGPDRRTEAQLREAQKRILGRVLDADIDVTAERSRAVYLAATLGYTKLIAHLLKRGASVDGRESGGMALNAGGSALSGALLAWGEHALLTGDEERTASHAFFYLLEQGADPTVPNDRGWTPLTFAVMLKQIDAVEALLQRGAQPDKYTWDAVTDQTPEAIVKRLEPYR